MAACLTCGRQSPYAGMINPITRRPVPEVPADKRVVYAELIYPFKGKPPRLTIIPPLDEKGRAIVTIGFIAYHKAVPIIDFRYLGAPAHLTLRWDDPWYSKFDNPNLKRHHKSALMSYLYVEPYEVRHEILTRVRDMERWMDLGLRGREYIEVDEWESLKKEYVLIGSVISLSLLLLVGWQAKMQRHRSKSIRPQLVTGTVLLAATLLLSPYMHISIGKPAIMAPTLGQAEATELMQSLLKNVYRAFDFRREEDVYDKLAVSVSGDLLSDVYLQNRKSFAVQRAGGAQAKVKEVEILEVAMQPHPDRPLALTFKSTWTALGTVGHWGHVHMRKNQYEAILTVEPVDGVWKITGLEMIEEKRIDPNTKPMETATKGK